ncbi:MAG: hypothetical protein IJN62_01430, partial [Clostridia bacterium]|nr:hypothetical protein [Clostridia bacterium]
YSSAFVCVMIIAVAQVGLKTDATRPFFTDIDTYEGAYFEAAAEVQPEQVHTITLHAESDDLKQAEIWLNGKSYSALTLGDNEIKITESSVVEIYAPECEVNVKLTDISDELVLYTSEREINVSNGLKIFGRLGIK